MKGRGAVVTAGPGVVSFGIILLSLQEARVLSKETVPQQRYSVLGRPAIVPEQHIWLVRSKDSVSQHLYSSLSLVFISPLQQMKALESITVVSQHP